MRTNIWSKFNNEAAAEIAAVQVRVKEIAASQDVEEVYKDFFKKCADKILLQEEYYSLVESKKYFELSLEELKTWNTKLYSEFYKENYETDYANPQYAVKVLGSMGTMLSSIYASCADMCELAVTGKKVLMNMAEKLFVDAYDLLRSSKGDSTTADKLKKLIYDSKSNNIKLTRLIAVTEQYNPSYDYYVDLLNNVDLSDLRYLYWMGKHVTDNEIKTAQFINSLSEKEVQSMADTFTNGFLVGYKKMGKDITTKKSTALYFTLGFERMERLVIANMKKVGITCLARAAMITTTQANRQFGYDHKDDIALFLDEAYEELFLSATKDAHEANKDDAQGYAGPLALETFGEEEFNPVSKKEAASLSDEQQPLMVKIYSGLTRITYSYVIAEERSFSIISYPIPAIGDKFNKIFSETVKVNTLDYKTYETIQQKLIDALDQADVVKVKGRGVNETDITVKTATLKDPSKESAFENCVADVNIPVGEVFTSPVLEGTNGLLHVTKVYLNGFMVKDLRIVLKDGMIQSCTCKNFDDDAANKDYLDNVIMFHHETLPIGEFAIGTNTTAYKMGIELDCQDKLPILIAEKTGPHFAMGDTCYSNSEDVKVYNPDGKEIIARENSVSALRKTDPAKAYFNCHTDVTIPYNELDTIIVHTKEGKQIELIRGGRFVLPGTEELNKPLDELEK